MTQKNKVVDAINGLIVGNGLKRGGRLPTEMELADSIGVSRGTLRCGLELLVTQGVIEKRKGVGYFVADEPLPAASKGRTVAMIVPSIESLQPPYSKIFDGIEELAYSMNCTLTLCNWNKILDKALSYIDKIREEKNLTGIIFAPVINSEYYKLNNRILDTIHDSGIKYVTIDTPVSKNGIIRGNVVSSDGYSAMRNMSSLLLKKGHRRIASIRLFSNVYSSEQRYAGILDQLEQEGIPFVESHHLQVADAPIYEQGRRELRSLLSLKDAPTAIICSNDRLALNVMDELRKMGLKVPEDISVCGFDGSEDALYAGLATVEQPYKEIGRQAVKMLSDGKSEIRHVFLPCRHIDGQSVSNPKIL